jgi:osmotically inducible lipoprotein OsmB
MRNLVVLAGALAFCATAAVAADKEQTLTGAAIGAGAGAVVAGPVGAVAGGAIGATVGGPHLPKNADVTPSHSDHASVDVPRHKIYWKDKKGHSHWRWSV